jgi:homogentisate 1,2-dioxygenase
MQDRSNRGVIRIEFLDSDVPYKYAMEKFVNVGSISKDHIDPSIFCVLTAKSKMGYRVSHIPSTGSCHFRVFI